MNVELLALDSKELMVLFEVVVPFTNVEFRFPVKLLGRRYVRSYGGEIRDVVLFWAEACVASTADAAMARGNFLNMLAKLWMKET